MDCNNEHNLNLYPRELHWKEGDPSSPFSQGRLCTRCLEPPELVNHESCLRYPLVRAGRG